jgi:hypothetical protein
VAGNKGDFVGRGAGFGRRRGEPDAERMATELPGILCGVLFGQVRIAR